jgi:hypothetical protein
MSQIDLPSTLQGVFFDKLWETPSIWLLPTAATLLGLDELVWHMDLTIWTTVPGQPRFDLAPATVMRSPMAFSRHWRKINNAQLVYPLELFQNGARWVIVDGYHRLCGHVLQRSRAVPVRFHPSECWERIEQRQRNQLQARAASTEWVKRPVKTVTSTLPRKRP